ncbi:MAG: hypothetical protein ACOYD9_05980 [Pyramidobacter sp.]
MCLPYWDSELDIEVGGWAFSNREHSVVSLAGLHSELLKKLSFCALALNSELLYLCGSDVGASGSMFWENAMEASRDSRGLFPFTLIFGYSSEIERFGGSFTARHSGLKAGVTRCTFWNKKIPLASYKVVALVTEQIAIDEVDCLNAMLADFERKESCDALIPCYAERFGFLRAPLSYETDRPTNMLISRQLENIQLEATRAVVGPSPLVPFPAAYDEDDDGETS